MRGLPAKVREGCGQRGNREVGGAWAYKFCEVVTDPAKPSTDTFFFFVKHIKTCDCVKRLLSIFTFLTHCFGCVLHIQMLK